VRDLRLCRSALIARRKSHCTLPISGIKAGSVGGSRTRTRRRRRKLMRHRHVPVRYCGSNPQAGTQRCEPARCKDAPGNKYFSVAVAAASPRGHISELDRVSADARASIQARLWRWVKKGRGLSQRESTKRTSLLVSFWSGLLTKLFFRGVCHFSCTEIFP
jgi:hypothetical protein